MPLCSHQMYIKTYVRRFLFLDVEITKLHKALNVGNLVLVMTVTCLPFVQVKSPLNWLVSVSVFQQLGCLWVSSFQLLTTEQIPKKPGYHHHVSQIGKCSSSEMQRFPFSYHNISHFNLMLYFGLISPQNPFALAF